MSEEKFEWTDDDVIDFHKKYMGSESHNIYNYLKQFKQSKLNSKDWEIVEYEKWEFGASLVGDTKKIKSVKRLSDGEIICVGDFVNDGFTTMKVENIKIENGSVVLVGDIGNMQLRFAKKQNKYWEIVEREPGKCFTTYPPTYEDGKIKSVKRLTDGEVFSIGDPDDCDKWSNSYAPSKIKSFSIANDGHMRVESENGCNNPLAYIKKVKQSLFKTEDGVDIYKFDKYWYITKPLGHAFSTAFEGKDEEWHNAITFSTEQAAKDYVIMNKPCLSLNDVVGAAVNSNSSADIICYVYTSKLKQLIEQKINAKV